MTFHQSRVWKVFLRVLDFIPCEQQQQQQLSNFIALDEIGKWAL